MKRKSRQAPFSFDKNSGIRNKSRCRFLHLQGPCPGPAHQLLRDHKLDGIGPIQDLPVLVILPPFTIVPAFRGIDRDGSLGISREVLLGLSDGVVVPIMIREPVVDTDP